MAQRDWAQTAERPWDPPLSAAGLVQAQARGRDLRAAGVRCDRVISSPFTRCIQTACGVMRAADIPPSALVIDATLAEWMSARNLNLAHVPAHARAPFEADVSGSFWSSAPEKGARTAIAQAWSEAAAQQERLLAASR